MEVSRYCLLFWFDGERNWSMQNATTILKPRKDPENYEEGEKVFAKFQGKTYPAFIIKVKECKDDLKESSVKLDSLMKTDLDVEAILKEMGIGVYKENENTVMVPIAEKEKSTKKVEKEKSTKKVEKEKSTKKVEKEATKRKAIDGKGASSSNKKKLVATDRAKATKEACKQILQQLPTSTSDPQPMTNTITEPTVGVKNVFDAGAGYMNDTFAYNWTDANAPSTFYNWEDPAPSASYNLAESNKFINFLASDEDKLREERDQALQQLQETQQTLQRCKEEIEKKDLRIRQLEEEVSKKQIVTTPSKVRFLRTLTDYFSTDTFDQTKSASRNIFHSPPPSRMINLTTPTYIALPPQPDQQRDPTISITSPKTVDQEWCSPVTRSGERKDELVKGREVFLTRSQMASLSIGGFSDARKVVIRVLDMLFDQRTLACMSAVGSRQAHNSKLNQVTQAMPSEVRIAIQEIILNLSQIQMQQKKTLWKKGDEQSDLGLFSDKKAPTRCSSAFVSKPVCDTVRNHSKSCDLPSKHSRPFICIVSSVQPFPHIGAI